MEILQMSLPLLAYPLSSQNHRVAGYEVQGDEYPRIYSTQTLLDKTEIDTLIWTAYRQIFNEQQILKHHRQTALESQLRSNQITVREFIRGLATSDSFRRLIYEANTNYRFVELCVQRLLGRSVYNNQEKLSWSILLATRGLKGFIDTLLNDEEYLSQFGDDTVPYQQRRILPKQVIGELPFARMARYGSEYRSKLPQSGFWGLDLGGISDRSEMAYRRIITLVPLASVGVLIATVALTLTAH
jgi:phycobilisome rod-core linker protein